MPPAKLRAFCKLDLRYWPMDKQQCFMKFASWTHHGGQIQLDLYNEKNNVSTICNYIVSPRQRNMISLKVFRDIIYIHVCT